MWSNLERVPYALEKKVYSSAFGWNVLKISMRSLSSNVSFKTNVSLLIFCFDDRSIGLSGVSMSPSILCYCQFPLLCLLVFVLCIDVSYDRGIGIYNCYIFLLDQSLDHYVVSFHISWNTLYFKVYFVWYQDCYSSFLLLPICMEYVFLSSHFKSICVFRSEVGFL